MFNDTGGKAQVIHRRRLGGPEQLREWQVLIMSYSRRVSNNLPANFGHSNAMLEIRRDCSYKP
jgi:hypothetical protein